MSTSTEELYTLTLDEEGYPILAGGIRANDEEFLNLVFSNLKRFQGDDKQALMTTMGKKEALVTAFDDPLVAKEIIIEGAELRWVFLGGLSYLVPQENLLVDEWNRLHALVGPEKIPAVMSSSAQAAFLLKHPQLEELRPEPYRSARDDVQWDNCYEEKNIPWDMGKASPVFLAHSERMIKESGNRWLIPGAGVGHEIPYLETKGKNIVAVDLSPLARLDFQTLYPNNLADYKVGDFFSLELNKFHAVMELCFFVALPPDLRPKIVTKIADLLEPRGFWGGSFFTRIAPGGPPYGLSEWELRAHIEPYFEILEWERSPHSHPRRRQMELWVLLRKK